MALRFSAGIILNTTKGGGYKIDVPVVHFKEDGVDIIFCPALEISSYGENIEEAKKAFEVSIVEFLRYTHNKNTLWKVLKSLGWSESKGKNKTYIPPTNTDLVNKNKLFNTIVNTKEYSTFNQSVELAM